MNDRHRRADEFCREILPSVSRTFALSIRILPGDLGAAVRDAYLLCRIADTIEDAPNLSATGKAALFDALSACFTSVEAIPEFVRAVGVVQADPAYLRLVRNSNLVFDDFDALLPETRAYVRKWVEEMIAGMRKFVLAYPDGIRIQTVDEYKEYCYYVAGTVGYMLTDLWREHASSIDERTYDALRSRSRAFAEALQTVNILKDVAADAEHENSVYIPRELLERHGGGHDTILSGDDRAQSRAALEVLNRLAWDDLDQAAEYLLMIPRRAPSIRLFCALPLLFAYATLRDLTRASHDGTHGVVKISRGEVKKLITLATVGVASNTGLRALIRHVRTSNKGRSSAIVRPSSA